MSRSKFTSANQANSYWENNPNAAYSSSQWTSNPAIAEVVYQRMSGGVTSKHWLSWLIEDYFKGRYFDTLLSPGCGTGDHETILAKSGIVGSIDAFDFSQSSILLARQKVEGLNCNVNFYQDDLNAFNIPSIKKYDVVLCSGSLHHVKELERFLCNIRNSLKPNGYFIINEYVGDCYNIYKKKQVEIINRLYNCFEKELVGKTNLKNSSIEQVLGSDPSEGVRSKLILPFIEYYFDIEVFHPFGGSILHPLYPLLNHHQFEDLSLPQNKTILNLLLEFESILMELPGGLESDFCLCILRHKK